MLNHYWQSSHNISSDENLIVRNFGLQDYSPMLQQQRNFTNTRNANTPDELWQLEHRAVFTQGQAGKAEHILSSSNIPIVQSDRGGQVTYHGPGQLIVYTLIDLQRKQLGVRDLVCLLEQAVIELLASYNIKAVGNKAAPGVYVDQAKICSLGLRVRRGCAYHGLSLNINMDLTPFGYINPCGYPGLQMTQLKDYVPQISVASVTPKLIEILTHKLCAREDK